MRIVPPKKHDKRHPSSREIGRCIVQGSALGIIVSVIGWLISGNPDWFFAIPVGIWIGAEAGYRPPDIPVVWWRRGRGG
jgi:hypothetical protein